MVPSVESAVSISAEVAGGFSHPPGDSILSETMSSVGSMDEDPVVSSAEVVRAVPNVKAAASLKTPSLNHNLNLSPQQKKNLAKKLRKKEPRILTMYRFQFACFGL